MSTYNANIYFYRAYDNRYHVVAVEHGTPRTIARDLTKAEAARKVRELSTVPVTPLVNDSYFRDFQS